MATGNAVSSRSGAPSGGASGNARSSRGRAEPRAYDFRRPSKLNREHIRSLQIAYETFGRQFSTILTSTLSAVSQVSLVSVQQLSYGEYVGSLDAPTFMALVTIPPLPGTGILQFNHDTAMTCFDRLLGGPGSGSQPERPFTEIESTLIMGLAQRIVHEMRYAFEGLVRITPTVTGLEHNPQFAQVAAALDPVIVASYEMRVGQEEGVATLALPFQSLYPSLDSSTKKRRSNNADVAEQSALKMEARLEDVPVDVSVQFRTVTLTPSDVLELRVGDVLSLQHLTSRPLAVEAGGVTFAHAVPGSKGRRLACLIVENPDHKEGDSR